MVGFATGFSIAVPRRRGATPVRGGFTLIELLVVISIIALLIGILLPALGKARESAKSTMSLSNLRQIGIATANYLADNKQHYPMHSSNGMFASPYGDSKPRWADYLYPYMSEEKAFLSPLLTQAEIDNTVKKPFWHTVDNGGFSAAKAAADPDAVVASGATGATSADTKWHGGYGWNFQYIGNARHNPAATDPFYQQTWHASADGDILAPSATIVVGDTAGSRKGNIANVPGIGGAAVYSLDPPLGSVDLGSRGSRKTFAGGTYAPGDGNRYYESAAGDAADEADAAGPADYLYRSFPAERNNGYANFAFADGHADNLTAAEADDSDGDGAKDNGLWNGRGDPTRK